MKYDTEKEIQSLLDAGMEQITIKQFEYRVLSCGYRRDKSMDFNYTNSGNAYTYQAKSAGNYKDCNTGSSAFHYQGRRDEKFHRLQEMRRSCFVVSRGVIWEL